MKLKYLIIIIYHNFFDDQTHVLLPVILSFTYFFFLNFKRTLFQLRLPEFPVSPSFYYFFSFLHSIIQVQILTSIFFWGKYTGWHVPYTSLSYLFSIHYFSSLFLHPHRHIAFVVILSAIRKSNIHFFYPLVPSRFFIFLSPAANFKAFSIFQIFLILSTWQRSSHNISNSLTGDNIPHLPSSSFQLSTVISRTSIAYTLILENPLLSPNFSIFSFL